MWCCDVVNVPEHKNKPKRQEFHHCTHCESGCRKELGGGGKSEIILSFELKEAEKSLTSVLPKQEGSDPFKTFPNHSKTESNV